MIDMEKTASLVEVRKQLLKWVKGDTKRPDFGDFLVLG